MNYLDPVYLKRLDYEHIIRVRKELGPEFAELERLFNAFELELNKAETQKNKERFKEIYKCRMKIKNAMRQLLQDNGYTKEDLKPRYSAF